MFNDAPVLNVIPFWPKATPSSRSPRRLILSLGPALIVMASAPAVTSNPAKPWPWMLIALVMVTAPYPSRVEQVDLPACRHHAVRLLEAAAGLGKGAGIAVASLRCHKDARLRFGLLRFGLRCLQRDNGECCCDRCRQGMLHGENSRVADCRSRKARRRRQESRPQALV